MRVYTAQKYAELLHVHNDYYGQVQKEWFYIFPLHFKKMVFCFLPERYFASFISVSSTRTRNSLYFSPNLCNHQISTIYLINNIQNITIFCTKVEYVHITIKTAMQWIIHSYFPLPITWNTQVHDPFPISSN